jgi:hypothetical protein
MLGWLRLGRSRRCRSALGTIAIASVPRGLRPVQIWVPDVRSPEFSAEAHRQAAAVAASKHAGDDQAFVDAVSRDEE